MIVWKAKWREIITDLIVEQHFLAEKKLRCLHPWQKLGAGCQAHARVLDPRERTSIGGFEDPLTGLV